MKDIVLSTLSDAFSKREGITVEFQKENEISYCVSFQVSIIVISFILVKYISSCFNYIIATRTYKVFS